MKSQPLQKKQPLAQQKAEKDAQEGKSLNPPAFQLKAGNGAAQPVQQKAASGGLPGDLVSGFAASTGHDLSDVKVHQNSDKPAQVGALAYAQGNDIHLGAGQEQHLAHEAAHIVQQREGKVQANTQVAGMPVNDSKSLESEADSMGAKAAQMKAEPAAEGKKVAGQGAAVQRKEGNPTTFPFKANIFGAASVTLGKAADGKESLGTLNKGTKVEVIGKEGTAYKVKATVGDKVLEGFVPEANVSATIAALNTTVAAVDADMNKMWEESFNEDKTVVNEQGAAIAEKGGSIYTKNKGSGGSGSVSIDRTVDKDEKFVGDVHTHPYSKDEGGNTGVAFSAGDISNIRNQNKQGYQKFVEAGTARFAMVVTDEAKAKRFFDANDDAAISKTWNDAFKAGTGTFEENVIAAVKAVIGANDENGLSFYATTDEKKLNFDAQ